MWAFLKQRTLTQWILAGMVAGVVLGWAAPGVGESLQPLSTLFLRAIKSIIVPLVFATLVVGITGHGDDLRKVGRLAVRAVVYFEVVTTLALVVSLVMVNALEPGVGVALGGAAAAAPAVAAKTTLATILQHIVPQSFFEAAAANEVLQVVFWSILFGLALTQVRGRPREVVVEFCGGLAEVMFKFTAIVMKFAPIGVGAALAFTVGHGGLKVLASLGALILTLYAALAVFVLVVLLPVILLTRVPLGAFVRAIKEPALIAFSTASSEAALPLAMERIEQMGVPRRIVAFVIPVGYTFNLDGSTLYLGVASIFVAQAAGVHLALGQQLLMMLTLMLTSKGVAGVPRAAIVILAATVASFNLPVEAVAVVFGVDQLMDMARTAINVVGNGLAACVMARWEGEFVPPEGSV
ncbi:MAG TPA: dicarboxylate/amino acid:cation symporter [Gemmatimonadales bacterium]|nr:dicarboxylate/amino acid:cation symporter [Gemmatimonadales bacterium]